MAETSVLLNGVEATGAGTAVQTTVDNMSFHCEGITTATVVIEVSNDGTNYITSGVSFTADGVNTVTGPYKYVRANCTAYTTGTITVTALT